jgi:hypothetical protein
MNESNGLVQNSIIRFLTRTICDAMMNRLTLAIKSCRKIDLQTPIGFANARYKVQVCYCIGRQVFYLPKTSVTAIIPYDRPYATIVPLQNFLNYEIGYGRDIKTTFINYSDDQVVKAFGTIFFTTFSHS